MVVKPILTLDGATMSATLDVPFVVNSGDVWSFETTFATTYTGANQGLMSDSSGDVTRAYIEPDGDVVIKLGAANVPYNPTIVLNDGKLHTVLLSFNGAGGVTVLIDGSESSGVIALANSAASIDRIAVRGDNSSLWFNGPITYAKFENTTTGASQTYGIDSGSTTTETSREGTDTITYTNVSAGDWEEYQLLTNIVHLDGTIDEAWVGEELITNGGFDSDTGWDKGTGWTISGGVATRANVGVNSEIGQTAATVPVAPVLMTINITALPTSGFKVRAQGGVDSNLPAAVGNYSLILTPGSSGTTRARTTQATTAGSIDNVSVRQILEKA